MQAMTHANQLGMYYPLAMTGTGWSLSFQLAPVPKITRIGPIPPVDELLRAVALCGLPAILVEVLQVVAACTPDSSVEDPGVRASTVAAQPKTSYHAAWRQCNGLPPLPAQDTTWSAGHVDPDRPVTGFPFDITPQ